MNQVKHEQQDDDFDSSIGDAANEFLRRKGGVSRSREARLAANRPCGDGQLPPSEYVREDWKHMADLGWLGILASEESGGLGLSIDAACQVARTIGRYLAPEPYTMVAGMVVPVLEASQTTVARDLLTTLISGSSIVTMALAESIDQSGLMRPEVKLDRQAAGRLELTGSKLFVTPGRGVDGWIVSANFHDKLALVYVAAECKGVTIRELPAVDGGFLSNIEFERVIVADESVLLEGDKASDTLERCVFQGRLLSAAELAGAGRAALETTLDYLKTREQFGVTIGSFQALQHRCVDAFIELELADAAIDDALRIARDNDAQALELAGARVKARANRAALQAAKNAVHFHGAMGITDECDVSLYFKRVLGLSARLGNTSVLQLRALELSSADAAPDAPNYHGTFPRSADWDAMPEQDFRDMLRAFLAERYPAALRYMPRRMRWEEIGGWYLTLARQGWLAPAWPREHGGMGLSPAKLIAFIEEFEQYGVARVPDQGILMVGPVLMRYGTADQRARFLPKILSGENIWCQGYSEPNAGSDLASLRTEAVDAGDHFVVTGQKIWTTLAHDSNHIFLLVRTDKTVRKQSGISFLLCDLRTPGITIRPIRDMTGHDEFCQVFFDSVRVPRENLVGEANQGWEIAKALLGFERIHLGSPKQPQFALTQLRYLGHATGLFSDSAFRLEFSRLSLDVADLSAAYARFASMVCRGVPLPPSVSLLKIWATETYQRIGEALAEHAGGFGGVMGDANIMGTSMNVLAPLFNSTAATIYGGSNEIQRNIIAKATLGLPS